MKCPNCGRENTEETNFCYYCGYSFREKPVVIPENTYSQPGYEQAPSVAPYRPDPQMAQESIVIAGQGKAMPVWQWVLYFMLLVIPYVRPVWLVVTGVWAFSEKSSPERKNFAKGLLIFLVAVVVFSIITAIILIATMGVDGAINYLTNGAATSADALMEMYYGK